MTHREYLTAISRKNEELFELQKMWEMLMRQAKEIEVKSHKTILEFQALMVRAKLVSGDFSPDDIIKEGDKPCS